MASRRTPLTPQRVMVCGGAGFVGSHLIERLLAEGHEVDAVDDLSTGSLANLGEARQSSGQFKFQHIDVASDAFTELVSHRRPAVMYHLSSFTPSTCHTNGALRSLSNTIAVLEAARLAGVSKVVTAVPATSMYGAVPARLLPVKEGQLPHPRSVVEVVTRAAVDVHAVYRDNHAVEYTVLALGNVYGPRQRAEDGVVAAFVESHRTGRGAILHGNGRQTRDFVYVDDAVDALARAIDRAGGLVINIGTGEQTTVRDLWTVVAGKGAPIPRGSSARPDDITRFSLSPVRARIQLGWSAFTALSAGVARTRDFSSSANE